MELVTTRYFDDFLLYYSKAKMLQERSLEWIPHTDEEINDRRVLGFIAQDVEKIIQTTGADFGGFKDLKVNGGKDALSIGYTEFIGPIIKAIQELTTVVQKQEQEIMELKSRK
jgi:hypothetical protein